MRRLNTEILTLFCKIFRLTAVIIYLLNVDKLTPFKSRSTSDSWRRMYVTCLWWLYKTNVHIRVLVASLFSSGSLASVLFLLAYSTSTCVRQQSDVRLLNCCQPIHLLHDFEHLINGQPLVGTRKRKCYRTHVWLNELPVRTEDHYTFFGNWCRMFVKAPTKK